MKVGDELYLIIDPSDSSIVSNYGLWGEKEVEEQIEEGDVVIKVKVQELYKGIVIKKEMVKQAEIILV